MTIPDPIEPLLGPVRALQRLIEHFDNQGVIIGGVATSILGIPRLTADADGLILLSADEIPHLLAQAEIEGLSPRFPDTEQFARQNRVVLLQHMPSGINVDISLGLLPFETEAVANSQLIDLGPIKIRLPTPEDLIILKAVAHRAKDLVDIEAIIQVQPTLDHNRIEFWVKQFADLLETPEIWQNVKVLLAQR